MSKGTSQSQPTAERDARTGQRVGPHTLAAKWASLEAVAMPPDVSPVQRQEMRRVFYCGASSLLHLLMTATDPGDEPTENDMALMQELSDELDRFRAELQREAAHPAVETSAGSSGQPAG